MPTIIVRPVGNTCNLACKYCYVDAVVSPNMSIAIFKKGLERITSFYLGENIKNIEILFHGGEPLLWGLNKYKKAEKVISESEEKYSIKYIKCIQTNLICYDSKFATFFKKITILLVRLLTVIKVKILFDYAKMDLKHLI